MKKLSIMLFIILLSAMTNIVFAEQSEKVGIVAPFGLPIGIATLKQVKADLDSKTKLQDAGINKYSNGPMLQSNGDGLGIDGLREVTFIFDSTERLFGVLMTLQKDKFDDVYNHLASKYELQSKQIPFVGNRYAKFKQGNVVIELDAPHMSFEMYVRYLSNELLNSFQQRRKAEDESKKKSEGQKF